jgi:hypothetical protein
MVLMEGNLFFARYVRMNKVSYLEYSIIIIQVKNQFFAQIIWYFIEGFIIVLMNILLVAENYIKYIVPLEEEVYFFLKATKRTGGG